MKRYRISIASLGIVLGLVAFAASASAATSISVNLQVGERYNGPSIVFTHQPDVEMIPDTRVYYVSNCDYDMYRYGSYWYYCYDNGWYRGRSPRGPFAFINYRTVPRAVYSVPPRYRRHWREFQGNGHAYGRDKQEIREVRREDRRVDRRMDRREARRVEARENAREDRDRQR